MEKPYAAWYKITKAAGLAGLRFHDLRHSFGSLGHMAGLSQRQIADMLGHASLATTERYLHGYQDDAARGVDVVAERVSSAWKPTRCSRVFRPGRGARYHCGMEKTRKLTAPWPFKYSVTKRGLVRNIQPPAPPAPKPQDKESPF